MSSPLPVVHHIRLRRFEARTGDGPSAFLSYTFEGDRVVFEHTFVPDGLRGQGVAANLVRAALAEARQQRWRIIPRCAYTAGFIRRNPEYADLLDRELSP